MKQMNKKIGVGVFWNLISLLMSNGSSTIFTLILARMLAPEAFGLIAMMMIVIELAQSFVQSGLGQAVIRSKTVSAEDLSTVFYSNLFLSVIAYAMLYACAPLLAVFYEQAELTVLLRTMGLVVFFNATKVVPIAILSRHMNFRSQMLANTVSVMGSGLIAVLIAWKGGGVWSLVVQSLLASIITAFLLGYMTRWKPIPVFSIESFKRLFGFGVNLLATDLIRILVQNSYVILIGRYFSAEVTGLYYVAKRLSHLVSQQLSGAVQKASYPAMATLQDDNTLLRHKYRQIIQIMMFIVAPVMAFLASTAEPLFRTVLGERWDDAIVYMQLLCIVATLYPLHAVNINILNVKGRSDLVFKIGLLKNASSLLFLFITLPFGVFWIIVGQIAHSILSLVPNTYFTKRLIGYGVGLQIVDVIKPCAAALLAGYAAHTAVLATSTWADLLSLAVAGATGFLLFLLISKIIGVEGLNLLLSRGRVLLSLK